MPVFGCGQRCRGTRLVRASALAVVAAATCLGALAQVSVGSSGRPSYSQAIAVPPGISGMQPNLSLMYAGGGVNGPVGHGWSVQGISMITRCPATRYTDAAARGVRFDAQDKLCLDGQRLIQTTAAGIVSPAAVFDANGKFTSFPQVDDARGLASGYREYRTEKDSFARIRAYGVANGSDANGPAYFKVWTKAGQIYEYGAAPSADANSKAAIGVQGQNIVMAWAVARVGDVVGNYIDFKYEVRDVAWGSGPTAGSPTLGREWNIAEIQYTGNGAQAPTNKVIFGYSDRSEVRDRGEAYQRGSKNVSVRRLDTISTYINSPNSTTLGPAAGAVLVRRTKLTYDNSSVTKRSRLASIKDCADAGETKCLPATHFTYANGGSEAFATHTSFNLSTTALHNDVGTLGVIPIDYDGDGRTDLLRWSDTASQNQLWRSNGNGTFTQVTAFNITDQNLFKSTGCFHTVFADFNGDTLPDLLRYSAPQALDGSTCTDYGAVLLYLNAGNGTFSLQTYGGPTLERRKSDILDNCAVPRQPDGQCTEPGLHTGWTRGANFFLLDVDGDGRQDIITTVLPHYGINQGGGDPCLTSVCTRIYTSTGSGAFTEIATNLSHTALYVPPKAGFGVDSPRNVVDVDGDGYADLVGIKGSILSTSSLFISRANGNFDPSGWGTDCERPMDFNADGRGDCLVASPSGTQYNSLYLSNGTVDWVAASAFNLKSAGQELQGTGVGSQVLDVNGDGRTDILRWKDNPASNALYLSNGDGSFTPSATFNLTASANLLAHSNGGTTYTLGDFLGDGSVQILRLKHNPSAGAATANQLYVKSDLTLPDQLLSVVSASGIKTSLVYGNLSDAAGGRYVSDRQDPSNKASYPLIDLVVASPVVVTMETDVGVGSNKVQTQFAYKGLKAALDGRGMLGFRQSVQQNTAPNGEALSVWTDYLLDEPYAGVARRTETRRGAWNAPSAQLLSRTVNTYCDRTSATAPGSATETTPCATNARVRRPYLRQSVDQGWDLSGATLPTVTTTNTYNDYGDPTDIVVTTTGPVADVPGNQTFTKTTANTFCTPDSGGCPNKIAGDNWILGRLTRSTVTNTVPNLLGALNAGYGNAALASATSGTLQAALSLGNCSSVTPTTTPTAATMTCTVSNTGQGPASSISYSTAANTTVNGPTGLCAAGATCGTVTVTTVTSAGSYTGTLIATPSSGSAASTSISLQVNTRPALTLSGCSSNSPTILPTPATLSCTVSNSGQTAASSIAYGTAANTSVSGPTGACAAGATCGTVTVTTATGAATYSGTLTATPNSGSAASQSISLVVNPPPTPPGLVLSGCSSTSPTTSPTAATLSCTLSNNGQTAASSVSYSTAPSTAVSGPTGACAAGSTCGTVTVTTGTGAATYSGTLTATPNTGTAASQGISLIVRTPPALALSGCSSSTPTTAPTAATMSCTVSNTGQTAAGSISYSTAANTGVSGPTGACAAGATCGTVTVTTGTSAGTYSGTLTATPSSGSAASQAVSLVVNTPPALALSGCSSTTPTTSPTAATMSCTVSNTGQTAAGSISYSTAANTGVSGPTGACAAGATCGTVTVTTGTSAGSYSGTLTATPNSGSGASQAISLVVNSAIATLTVSPTSLSFGTVAKGVLSGIQTLTITNTSATAATTISYSLTYTSGTSSNGNYQTSGGTCPAAGGSLAAGASCTRTVRFFAGCTGGSRNANWTLSGSNFTALVVPLTASTSSSGICN